MQTALIAGATTGIGAQYARRLAEDGHNLIITSRRETKIKALANELAQSYDSGVGVILVELSNPVQVNEFIENIKDQGIHLLVNIAGFGTAKFFYHEPLGLQEKMIYAHILAHIHIIYVVLPQMIEKGAGMIINVSSAGAFLPSPKIAVCNGTKAFLGALTESLHKELAGSGVQVQVVCPGLTWTDMQIRLGISEEVTVDWEVFQWISPQEVVACSIALYYKITNYFFRKKGWTEGV